MYEYILVFPSKIILNHIRLLRIHFSEGGGEKGAEADKWGQKIFLINSSSSLSEMKS